MHTKNTKTSGGKKISRRRFIQTTAASTVAVRALGVMGAGSTVAHGATPKSTVFEVTGCPVPVDGAMNHVGVDTLLYLLSANGQKFYQTATTGELNGPNGLIAPGDVVILKVNAQWKCRGCTNTDVLRGLIYRILQHPDGFSGEVVIFENGQGRPAAFDGIHNDDNHAEYKPFPELNGVVMVNAEQEHLMTINYLVGTLFKGQRVSSFLMDPHTKTFIADDDHKTDGYRRVGSAGTACVSYPCYTTTGGHRIELKEGLWTGSAYAQNLKLIHLPVLKDHSGNVGMTGPLKIVYGTLSMSDGSSANRHYSDQGSQCAKMWTEVRPADLNILDCIWVSYGATTAGGQHVSGCIGYPPSITSRQNILTAGIDPVALDYHAAKHILLPLGGADEAEHNPDKNSNLINVYNQAKSVINGAGGIKGEPVQTGDGNINVIETNANNSAAAAAWKNFA